MMTHDPFQNYQTTGAYSGGATQFGQAGAGFQPFNPLAFAGQQLQNPGIGGYGIPQPYQGAGFAGQGQQNPLQQLAAVNPFAAAVLQNQLLQQALLQNAFTQNPGGQQGIWQNPLQQAGLQNPFLQHQQAQQNPWQQNPFLQYQQAQGPWQNPQFNPLLALYGWQQQQPQLPYPLAPQSLIGAGGIGQQFSQIHPLAQLAQQRQAGGYGASPFAGYF